MIAVKWLPRPAPYPQVWQAMQRYTEERGPDTPDEIWLVEHEPVYTLGQAGKPEHILNSGAIPVVRSNRGGQVTYHGPGQVVAYCLVDLRRAGLYVKEYVALLEDTVIGLLRDLGLDGACRKPGAPGVYVPVGAPSDTAELAKIAALGIKVRNGCAYHGIALNVDMDLTPFLGINPCGYEGLHTTDLAEQGVRTTVQQAGEALARRLVDDLTPAPKH
ncbi:lipoyl(octanoyl) transferase LipB [Pusillimonas sp.]|uniref:lipoyl(octanoyl) transferase LipB n=1 Tax=Pusillimonas sp. TaxID=3040095 RepID=UPI0029A20BE1|nr:lipoyl(octanoyl) transferase LipB [Pusillimonas sp.]MDX3894497.1 lipoyl(octanoyl) transferase LipB [Pusillimonas sp.]